MTFLVDTNVVSEARRGDPLAVAWMRAVPPDAIFLSVVTIGEIARGIALKEKKDKIAAAHLQAWLDRLRSSHADRILPVTESIANAWGRLAARRSRGDADGLIAATALIHGLTIVTRNASDFEGDETAVLNPWKMSA